jgi:pimeloyl-ACP methyl ester carboxylesterase
MGPSFPVRSATVRANGLEFALLEAGAGPLALCLHGFPDTAHTWRHLLPDLAGAGFHAVAPFMRGYAPTGVPADGACQLGALISDAVALHEVLSGGGDAVLIGHDWGAEAAYGAAAHAPDRWRRLVTLAVPPASLDPVLFSDYEQLKRFFYLFLFRDPAGFADALVASDGMSFLDRLWHDWSPGYDAREDLAAFPRCRHGPPRRSHRDRLGRSVAPRNVIRQLRHLCVPAPAVLPGSQARCTAWEPRRIGMRAAQGPPRCGQRAAVAGRADASQAAMSATAAGST